MVQVHLGLIYIILRDIANFLEVGIYSVYILLVLDKKSIKIDMAVPKKKISVSRKKIRLNSLISKSKNYTQCKKCFNFSLLHRKCSCESFSHSTNLKNKYII